MFSLREDALKLSGAELRSSERKTLNLALLGYKGRFTHCIGNTVCAAKLRDLREKMATRHKVKHVHKNTVCNTQHEDNQVEVYSGCIYGVTLNVCKAERLSSHSKTTGRSAVTLNAFQINSLAIVQQKERPLDRYTHFTAAVLHCYSTNSDPLFSTINNTNIVQ